MTNHPRSDWTDANLACSDRFDPAAVRGVAIHWVGSSLSEGLRSGANPDVAAFLRACRANNVADDYCDIEYNWAVDGDGEAWACRGMDMDGGANGTTDANDRYVSILVIYPVGGRPTPAQIAGVKRLVRRIRDRYPNAKAIKPHQHFVPTQCPGPAALELIRRGAFEPGDGSGDRALIEKLQASASDLGDRWRKLTQRIKDLRATRAKVGERRESKRDRIRRLRHN